MTSDHNERVETVLPTRYSCLSKQLFERSDYSLAPVALAHIEPIRIWRNTQMNVLRQSKPISPAEQARYFTSNIWPEMAEQMPTNILLAFFNDGTLIGYGGLVHIAWEHQRAEVSFLVDPARAVATATYAADFSNYLELIKEVAFRNLNLNRLFTESYAFRTAHISILEQAGFKREGVMRRHAIVDGAAIDSIFHGLLRTDEK